MRINHIRAVATNAALPHQESPSVVRGRRPEVDAEAWVAPNTGLIGQVRLAARASVWYEALIGMAVYEHLIDLHREASTDG